MERITSFKQPIHNKILKGEGQALKRGFLSPHFYLHLFCLNLQKSPGKSVFKEP
jgi:hypothetical protein